VNRMQFVCRFACVVLIVLAMGQAPVQSQSQADNSDGFPLTLDDALRIALKNNLDLVTARVDPRIAAQQVEVEGSVLDGTLSVSASYDDDPQDLLIKPAGTDSFDGSNNRETIRGDVTWADPLSFGATYSVIYNPLAVRADGRDVSQAGFFTDYTQEYDQNLITLRYEMPLLKGFGKEVKTERLVLAREDLEISRETLRVEALRVMEAVEGSYWDVVAAVAAMRTAELALNRAEDLLELNRKKVEVGTLAPIEITQAEAGVASQQEGVIVSEMTLRNAEDELRRLLAIPASDPAWDQVIDATDRPVFEEQSISVEDTLAVAIESRPEVINARRQLSKSELSERVARKQQRHQLDLRAEVAPSADDNLRSFAFPTAPQQNNDTSTEGDGVRWFLGLNYVLPVGNRQATASRRIAALSRQKSEINLTNIEQTVRVEVRTAVRGVESGIKRVQAAQKNVELQNEKLEAEQKKFENGMSTSFEVLTFQNDLADAELSMIRAGLAYAKALTAVERAKGTLLQARGLSLDAQ